ncbi:hypothetical protein EBB07_33705 [Paenibacillaceae bacterium]|nr:hypothetical protein EBB07_33705 [Paenibacillaceae bacterium]
MIQTKTIQGHQIRYVVSRPLFDKIAAAYREGATVKQLGQESKADVACSFNFSNDKIGAPIGFLKVDGEIVVQDVPKTAPRDVLYMLPERTLHIGKAPAAAVWAVQGSPRLLDNGRKVIDETAKRDQTGADILNGSSRRTAAGITKEGYLVLATSIGVLTLDQMADVMSSLGCVHALNGDGGGSTYLWPQDNGWGRLMGSGITITEGKSVVIDAGHGGKDPGAIGSGLQEKDLALKLALRIGKLLADWGAQVSYTRQTDVFLELSDRAAIANKAGANFFLSTHINAGATDKGGFETFRYTSASANSKTYQETIHRHVAALYKAKGRPDRGVKTANLAVLRQTKMPAVLMEYGFISHAEDVALLKDATWLEQLAQATAEGVAEALGIEKREEAPQVPKKTEFNDVPAGHWAEASIAKAAAAGVLAGVSPGVFGLGQPVTREQLAVILDRVGLLK